MYAKLFTSIYQGTLRGNAHGLLVFTNLLAHADSSGCVDIHPRAVADETGLTIEQVRAALDFLESPDTASRSPEEEGRRIVRLDEHRDWGWNVVNYLKYRAIRNEEDRREQNRLSQQRFRSKHSQPRKPASAQAEAEAEAPKEKRDAPAALVGLEAVPVVLVKEWKRVRKSKRLADLTQTALDAFLAQVRQTKLTPHEAIKLCVEQGWGGLKASWLNEDGTPKDRNAKPNPADVARTTVPRTTPCMTSLGPEMTEAERVAADERRREVMSKFKPRRVA
jgi:hypothetical protein